MARKKKEVRTPYDSLRFYSALTHGIGAWMACVATAVLITLSAFAGVRYIVSFSLYGAALIGLYTTSTLYHCLKVRPSGRKALRKLDHIMIYMLIAGTYTPLCLISLEGAWRWSIFGVTWGMAVLGSIIKIFYLNAPRVVSTIAYIGMGWMALVAIVPLWRSLSPAALIMLGAGGFFYTFGAVLYALKWPGEARRYFGFHEVFHIFILIGSICHFIMMMFL